VTKAQFVFAATLLMTPAAPAMAQDAYQRGYHNGYYDYPPPSSLSDSLSDYNRGFHQGRDDSYDDDYRMWSIQRDREQQQQSVWGADPYAPR
jgi:hypothetical protein